MSGKNATLEKDIEQLGEEVDSVGQESRSNILKSVSFQCNTIDMFSQ